MTNLIKNLIRKRYCTIFVSLPGRFTGGTSTITGNAPEEKREAMEDCRRI